jgi:hypothetical protein
MFAGTAMHLKLADAGWYVDALLAGSLCFSGYRGAENLQAAVENSGMELMDIEAVMLFT